MNYVSGDLAQAARGFQRGFAPNGLLIFTGQSRGFARRGLHGVGCHGKLLNELRLRGIDVCRLIEPAKALTELAGLGQGLLGGGQVASHGVEPGFIELRLQRGNSLSGQHACFTGDGCQLVGPLQANPSAQPPRDDNAQNDAKPA